MPTENTTIHSTPASPDEPLTDSQIKAAVERVSISLQRSDADLSVVALLFTDIGRRAESGGVVAVLDTVDVIVRSLFCGSGAADDASRVFAHNARASLAESTT